MYLVGRGSIVKFKGTQIAIDMYGCSDEVISNPEAVEAILREAIVEYHMEERAVHYNAEDNGEYSLIVPCKRGHINLHVYPQIGFAAVDVFTVNDAANPDKLAVYLRAKFAPDKSKITFLERGDFGSQNDMKPRRKSQIKTIRRAKNAGNALKKLMMRPKSL